MHGALDSIVAAQQCIGRGETTCTELLKQFLTRINEGAYLNAFISILGDPATRQAEAVDNRLRSKTSCRLAGAVVAVKDNIAIKGERLTCGSRMLENYISPYHATVVERLLAEDAILIGKTNLDEFAMGSSNENSYFGAVKYPFDENRVPGGSSGGACVAVATGQANAAIASDTGGSIRQPAAFCGVVGLKPTYGRVSRYGLVAFASSFDQIGTIANTVEDAALLLEVIAGHDKKDATCSTRTVPAFSENIAKGVKGLRIGLPAEYFGAELDSAVELAIEKTRALLEDSGAVAVEVRLPSQPYAVAAYQILSTAEASSNLARFDGARYGFRATSEDIEQMYVQSRTQGFGDEVKRRIMLGTFVLSSGYYGKYYEKAQQVRKLIISDFERAFEQCDILLTPTCPTTAFKLGEKTEEPLEMYLSDIYTVAANLTGFPAISVPCGVDANKLPIGAQIIGKPFDEGTIIRVADFIQRQQTA